jgi:hypothetical protein
MFLNLSDGDQAAGDQVVQVDSSGTQSVKQASHASRFLSQFNRGNSCGDRRLWILWSSRPEPPVTVRAVLAL